MVISMMDEAERVKAAPAKKRKIKPPVKFKKAPQAPRRFKSAYMFFSTAKHPEIRARLKEEGRAAEKTTHIAKMVSQEWKSLSSEERDKWDEMASKDKARFEMEKTMYTGPWKVPAKKKSKKDPDCPKRPMSAFLSFSNSKRAETKREHPHASNAEISRILAQLWKEASEEERKGHIDKEYKLRQEYKVAIAAWKEKAATELKTQRHEREEVARKAAADRENGVPVADVTTRNAYHAASGAASYYYPPAKQGAASYAQAEDGGAPPYPSDPSAASYGNPYAPYYQQSQYGYPAAYEGQQPPPQYGNPAYGAGYPQYASQYGYPQVYEGAPQPSEGEASHPGAPGAPSSPYGAASQAYIQQGAASYPGYGDYSGSGAEQQGASETTGGQQFSPAYGQYERNN